MGQQVRSESLFYYFKLDDYLPENHLLRLIDQHISFAFVRERLKDSYNETGRPSIGFSLEGGQKSCYSRCHENAPIGRCNTYV
jgi:hypothetical protein